MSVTKQQFIILIDSPTAVSGLFICCLFAGIFFLALVVIRNGVAIDTGWLSFPDYIVVAGLG